jgi:hypothetical protein
MTSATQRALVARANEAANLMDTWHREIVKQLVGQENQIVGQDFWSDKTVKLKAGLVNAMLSHMSRLSSEIRRFSA